MIFNDFFKALTQLPDRRFQSVLWRGIGLALLLLVGAAWLVSAIVGFVAPAGISLPLIGEISNFGSLLSIGAAFAVLGASVFLMIPVASAMSSLFLDDVAAAVEAEHHPNLPQPPGLPWSAALRDTFAFLGLLIVANSLAIALYFVLPFAAPLIFYALNGFLLGREYFQVAAMRREGRAGARALRRKHGLTIWIAGCMMAIPLTIPLVNLLVPVLGAATFTHLYHRLAG